MAEGVNFFENTLKKYYLKGMTNVYLYRLVSFFNHRRQNSEFLTFTSTFDITLKKLKAAWNDLMPILRHCHQSSRIRSRCERKRSCPAPASCRGQGTASRSTCHARSRSTETVHQRHADKTRTRISTKWQPHCTILHHPERFVRSAKRMTDQSNVFEHLT